jgi:hypothetical protein
MSVRILSFTMNRLLLYGGLAAAGLILLLLLLFSTMRQVQESAKENSEINAVEDATYYPGVYSTTVVFGTEVLTLEMTFSASAITSVSCPLSDSIRTLYPLVAPTLSSLESQLQEGTALDSVSLDGSFLETGNYLKEAMAATIQKAKRS